ncbi:MAG: Rrf2 family transcriptional regulator [Pseudomonadales bacterium]
MKLTTKGRYAVTAMLDLAMHSSGGPVSLADICKRQKMSQSYLEQLFAKLRRKHLIDSVRGPGGGYRLNRGPGEIFVTEIIDAVEESVDTTSCGGVKNCQAGAPCLTHHLWTDLNREINAFLDSVSLASLMQRSEIRSVSKRQDAEVIKAIKDMQSFEQQQATGNAS